MRGEVLPGHLSRYEPECVRYAVRLDTGVIELVDATNWTAKEGILEFVRIEPGRFRETSAVYNLNRVVSFRPNVTRNSITEVEGAPEITTDATDTSAR